MPIYSNLMIRPYASNPYVELETKGGLLLTNGEFDSQDSGEHEKLTEAIACAEVIEVGPDCKYIKRGDDVYFNMLTARPVPFMRQGFFLCAEQNVLAVMNENLNERFNKL